MLVSEFYRILGNKLIISERIHSGGIKNEGIGSEGILFILFFKC